jgi:hypothetical protein
MGDDRQIDALLPQPWRTLPISPNLQNTKDSASRIRRLGSCSSRSLVPRN